MRWCKKVSFFLLCAAVPPGGDELVNALDTTRQQTALHKAAWYGRMDICKKLVDAGTKLNIKDYKVTKQTFPIYT